MLRVRATDGDRPDSNGFADIRYSMTDDRFDVDPITVSTYEPCDFQQCDLLTSVDSNEPMQPTIKLRNTKCCSVGSLTVIEYSSD